jgi:membrane protein
VIPPWLKRSTAFALELYDRFSRHNGWAMSSHIALSVLLAFFPFLIVVVSLTSALTSGGAADQVIALAFESWPPAVAQTFSSQLIQVLHNRSGGLLTFSIVVMLWASSSGVEALRLALDSAYAAEDRRAWWLLRLESILFVVIGALAMFVLAAAVVLWPVLWNAAVAHVPLIHRFAFVTNLVRFGLSGIFLLAALVVFHLWLAEGRRRVLSVMPGVLLTLALWFAIAIGFGFYLTNFSANYAATYAGLGGIVAAILFLYFNSVVFILGAEFNATLSAHGATGRLNAEAEPVLGSDPQPRAGTRPAPSRARS